MLTPSVDTHLKEGLGWEPVHKGRSVFSFWWVGGLGGSTNRAKQDRIIVCMCVFVLSEQGSVFELVCYRLAVCSSVCVIFLLEH